MPIAAQCPTLSMDASLPVKEQDARVLAAFDALAIDGRFTLVSRRDPRSALYHVQNVRPGMFDWWPLEEGPHTWRVAVHRRCHAPDEARPVSGYLHGDHQRLDGLLAQARELVARGDFPAALARFTEFALGVRRHIVMEEEVLFPMFEHATGMEGFGPTEVLRLEHMEIRDLVDATTHALESAKDAAAFDTRVGRLALAMAAHSGKEEHVLYALTDRSLRPELRTDLILRMQAV